MENYLHSIASYLKRNPIVLSSNNRDGRANSIINEDEVLDLLVPVYQGAIERSQIRSWYDFLITDGRNEVFVNIKVSDLSNGSADNLSAKQGMGYALTGIKDMPNDWKAFNELLFAGLRSGFDYYFLVINKKDTSDVFWTSLKRIETLQSNGNNLPFQCCWKKNRVWSKRNEYEATEYILCKYIESWRKRKDGFPSEIVSMLSRGELPTRMENNKMKLS